jgi:acyl carrier protein
MKQASLSLINELESNFKLSLSAEELVWLRKWRNFPEGKDLFTFIKA